MTDKIGRHVVACAICAAVYFVAREIWTFPLDSATYWFTSFYGLGCTIIYRWVFDK